MDLVRGKGVLVQRFGLREFLRLLVEVFVVEVCGSTDAGLDIVEEAGQTRLEQVLEIHLPDNGPDSRLHFPHIRAIGTRRRGVEMQPIYDGILNQRAGIFPESLLPDHIHPLGEINETGYLVMHELAMLWALLLQPLIAG